MINDKLFETEDYYLSEIDFEKDPEVDSNYSLNLRYARYWCDGFPKPLSKNEFKKKYEKIEKKIDESRNMVHFAVRDKVDHRLVGFVRINILWNHAVGWTMVSIGDSKLHSKAERQIIPLVLHFAFRELNLFRLEVDVPEYEEQLGQILEENGFSLDAVNRGVIFFENQYWNEYLYGILLPEWNQLQEEQR